MENGGSGKYFGRRPHPVVIKLTAYNLKMANSEKFTIAAVQATPVFMDLGASVEKACCVIEETGVSGAKNAVFSEGFLPGSPQRTWFIPPMRTHPLCEIYAILHENSVSIPGQATDLLFTAAKKAGVFVAIPVIESNSEVRDSTILDTFIYI